MVLRLDCSQIQESPPRRINSVELRRVEGFAEPSTPGDRHNQRIAHLKNSLTFVVSSIAFTCKNRASRGVRSISGIGNRGIELFSVRRVYSL
jgi:hypothetical protein